MTCVGTIPFTEGSGYESIEPNVLKKYGDDAHEQKVVLGISLVNARSAILMKSIYMLFAGWEVRMVKNCDRGLENTKFFPREPE